MLKLVEALKVPVAHSCGLSAMLVFWNDAKQ